MPTLILLLALSLTACGGIADNEQANDQPDTHLPHTPERAASGVLQ